MNGRFLSVLMMASIMLLGCKKEEIASTDIDLAIRFTFSVDRQELVLNSRQYVNEAGNLYEVNEVKFFISDVKLQKSDGSSVIIGDVHYVEYGQNTICSWDIDNKIPAGDYTGISFTFGLSPAHNISNTHVNPPECDMAWPAVLGGGYHYMQINGKWETADGTVKPFNLHTGRGQEYDSQGQITGYIDNQFEVFIDKVMQLNENASLKLNMNVNSWFNTPYVYDLDYWGGSIMQNQDAQEQLKANGKDVFTISL